MYRSILWVACLASLLAPASTVSAQSLRGSPASLDRQNEQARAHDFTYLRDRDHVRKFVNAGILVPVSRNADYEVARVSFPYARPEAKMFIERLSRQYRAACGEKLVVTSLTRPMTHQPPNASERSVHPTGMAIDLRVSRNHSCRSWLEETLLYLEDKQIIEATRERRPPHYHVVLYPNPYANYLDRPARSAPRHASRAGGKTESAKETTHRVGRGDSLWSLARRYGVSVDAIKTANNLRSARIKVGEELTIPK